jgi:hypothetical protein
MKNRIRSFVLKAVAITIVVQSIVGLAMAIEEPKYTVEEKNATYEIRKYSPILVAETLIDDSFEDSGNKAFRILADYIFGNNTARAKIDAKEMLSQKKNEKIAMTAPVNLQKAPKGYLCQFTMPEKYNLETLPQPNDSRVQIRQIPARQVAVLTYTGSWSESKFNEKRDELLNALKANGRNPTGEPVFARFNSPFQIWFLRRNEIWVELLP